MLCVIISSEICERFLLKDHRKFLRAKEQLYKPKQQLLLDFSLYAPISAYLLAVFFHEQNAE